MKTIQTARHAAHASAHDHPGRFYSGLVVAALVVVVIAAAVQALTKREGVRTLWAAVRMTAQLVVVGFVLTWVFDNPNPAITVLLLAIMIGFGIFTVYGQHRGRMNARQRWVVAAALARAMRAVRAVPATRHAGARARRPRRTVRHPARTAPRHGCPAKPPAPGRWRWASAPSAGPGR